MMGGRRAGRGERGIALAAAVFAMVALAALVAGLWFAALQEYKIGANVVSERRAFDAAEAGLDATLAGWNARLLDRLAVGDTAPLAGAVAGGAATYSGAVRRLGPWLFLVRVTGVDPRASSGRTLEIVVRLVPQRLDERAALVAAGPVRLGAGALVDALAPDTGAGCAGSAGGAAGIVVGGASDLDISACTAGPCLRGDPGWRVDTALGRQTVPLIGEEGWARLAARAETVSAGGRPPSGAGVYLAQGDLILPAGDWPGPSVLLVQGDLVLETGSQLAGLVVVRGRLVLRGAGATIRGAAIVGSADLSALGGMHATLVHSDCAALQALQLAAPAQPLEERAWTVVYKDAL
jgi:hypothetical protein